MAKLKEQLVSVVHAEHLDTKHWENTCLECVRMIPVENIGKMPPYEGCLSASWRMDAGAEVIDYRRYRAGVVVRYVS